MREALPSHPAMQSKRTDDQLQYIERVHQYVDKVTLPLVPGIEQNAL
ncbi:hypothetical protein [Modestobacter marinus]|nr:hypothetical protein [Modestobacter marinus]